MAISGIRAERPVLDPEPSARGATATTPTADVEGAFTRALRGLGREIDVGEAQVSAASRLRSYDTSTLIALQVGIYRYTEAVDLASKIVDRATSALKTVVQGSH